MPFTNTVGSNTIEGYRPIVLSSDTDPYWNDVILLLQPQSADGNALDDKSQYNFSGALTNGVGERGGQSLTNVTLETAPGGNKWPSSNTINFNGSNQIICADYVSNLIANSGSPDTWTVEMWFHIDTLPASGQHLCLMGFHGNTFVNNSSNPHVDNHITFWMGNAASGASGLHYFFICEENGTEVSQNNIAPLPAINTWQHVAIVNDNKSLSVYLNGTRVVNGRTIQTTVRGGLPDLDDGNRDSFQIGADQDSLVTNDFCDMHVAGFRVTKNQARYSGASYGLPTEPFPLRGTTTTTVGAASGSPITCENEALRFLDENNSQNNPTLAWIQHPRVNGNSAYQAYLIKDRGYAWVLAAKLASDDLNNQIYSGSNVTGTQTGKPAFTWQNRPAHTVINDWGTDTHTFNHTAYDTTLDKSMRTRIWPELRSKYKRIYVGSWNHADGSAANSGMVLYKQNRGKFNENEIGVNQSWGEFIENIEGDGNTLGAGQNDGDGNPSARFSGADLPADPTHIWPNETDVGGSTLNVAGMKKYGRTWNYDGLDFVYLGSTDREAVPTATNDCAMISGATTERGPSAMPQCTGVDNDDNGTSGSGGCNGITGIGVKRSSIDSNGFAAKSTDNTTIPKGNNINATDHNNGNYHGLFATRVANGNLRTEESARMNFWTRLQGGDGSTPDRAFDGSLMELDSLWYNNSISNGLYWFTTKTLGIVLCDVVTRDGKKWIRVPFGNKTTNHTTSAATNLDKSMLMKDSCPALSKFVFNIGSGAATVANLTFDSSGRLGNGNPSSTTTSGSQDHNQNIGWAIWDLGIPFRQLEVDMSFRNHWATGTGGDSADWNGIQRETPWDGKTIQPEYTGGDNPFVVIPDPADPLGKVIAVNGAGISNWRTSSSWTQGEQIPAVTHEMKIETTIEMGKVSGGARQDEHAAEAYRIGVGFAGFGNETYRCEEGYFYIR